ncbi:MAG: RNA-binding protein [Gammaproteobacteria bacterium]|jgi:RNA-binding protein|tara:strand:- start:129 stop:440 length:312 start_codon:yes stop_codon:yes gene_type:complete
MSLTETQKKALKKLAHNLKPVIMVGNAGVTASLLAELDSTIEHHELMKVKVNAGERDARDAAIKRLCKASKSELVGRVGNIATLYRAPKKGSKKESKITLPKT